MKGNHTELFYVTRFISGISLQSILQAWSFLSKELIYGPNGFFVLSLGLEWLDGGKVFVAGVFQLWDGQFLEFWLRCVCNSNFPLQRTRGHGSISFGDRHSSNHIRVSDTGGGKLKENG